MELTAVTAIGFHPAKACVRSYLLWFIYGSLLANP